MSLLALERVCKGYRDGQLERQVLREVTLEIDPGELSVVWGVRRCGRSTLLRLAAGIEAPDGGVVRFDGHDLAEDAERVLGAGIGYCQKSLPRNGSQPVLEIVMASLLAHGLPASHARSRAGEALDRAGVGDCATRTRSQLDSAETVRVALARVLALNPRLLVIDDPIAGVDVLARDGILALLRSLANDGLAVLASTTDATGLSGADRTLTLSEGRLRGPATRELAAVVELRRHAGG